MPEAKAKHPSWFKMKLERRELVRQLAPETAVNVLLACWDYLETGERPATLSPIESVAFASFMPDMEEAWSRYLVRVSSGAQGGRPKKDEKPYGSICPHTVPYGTEEETEVDSLLSNDNRESGAGKPPKRTRFVPPDVEEVRAYCLERRNGIDADAFVDYHQARGWKLAGGQSMKDWRATVRTWERREKQQRGGSPNELPFL